MLKRMFVIALLLTAVSLGAQAQTLDDILKPRGLAGRG